MKKNPTSLRGSAHKRLRQQGNAGRNRHLFLESLEDRPLFAVNAIVTENMLPGTSPAQWQVAGAGDTTIQGFARSMSVDQGETIQFSINDPSGAPYRLDIYRMGYYHGNGARLVTTIPSSQTLRQSQPAPLTNYATGLVDAGNWSISTSWAVPEDATSGIYIANVTREDTGGKSQILFVVRDDDSTSDLFFQTSDSTWQAYNGWDGTSSVSGTSLYSYNGSNPELQARGKAMAVSYNRPLTVAATTGGGGDYNSPMHAEYPMVRWLEANGYDISYTTNVDTAIRGDLILNHKVFLSVGHDEYWSAEQRNNVEAARAAGINLAFFSGNEIFWKTRWEPSINSTADPYRTVVTYKESQVNTAVDPMNQAPTWVATSTWRDLRFGGPADAGRPENALTGTLYMNDRTSVDLGISMNVPASDANLRFWRNTSVANLQPGEIATLGEYVVGYETNEDLDNGFRPAGLITMSSTTFDTTSHVIVPWGSTVGPGTSTHKITLYRAASGALVFGAGTVQWSWGLDGNHINGYSIPDPAMQQATVNLLADMNVQPATLQPGLVRATASTDVTAPTSVITAPLGGVTYTVGSTITITGTATDAGGGVVGGVEISTDGGKRWHPVVGRANWSYTWTVDRSGPIVILTRASDDSANLEIPSSGVTVTGVLQPTSTTGLVAQYNFDEGTGTTIHDLSGFNNVGTASNITWVPGLFGQAASFNGTNSWITINSSSSLNLTSGMTLEAWVKPTGTGSGYEAILTKETSGGLAYSLYATDGVGQPPSSYVNMGGSDAGVTGLSTLPLNAWSFLAATYDGSTLRLYVNGSLVSEQDLGGSITTSSGVLRIGGNSIWGEYFQGLIDQIRIYNRPLNAGEIVSDMNTPIGGTADKTPPTGAMTSPASGATLSGVASLSATAADNVMVAGVQFLLNGVPIGQQVLTAPYTFSWDTRLVANGTYTLSAIVTDAAGNVTSLSNRTVTIANSLDLIAPSIVLKNPGSGRVSGTIVPSAVVTDDLGVASVQYQLNGVDIGPLLTNAPYRIAWDSATVPDGTYTLTAVARDLSGNVTTSTPIILTVDNMAPVVTATTPASGSTNVPTSLPPISVTFNEAIAPGSAWFLLTSLDGYVAAGQVTLDATGRTISFIPNGTLEPSTTYTLTVIGAVDLAGNPMNPLSWTFTTTSTVINATLWGPATTPAIISDSDTDAIELGVKFTSDIAGYVTGIRFYKGTANIGTHVGNLWDAAGNLLASVTFTGETSSGWQQANFSQPVAIAPGVTYVASYFAPSGRYSADPGYFATAGTRTGVLQAPSTAVSDGNGVFRYGGSSGFPSSSYNSTNYWVDVVFSNALVPTVTIATPTNSSTGISGTDPQITATFNKPVQADTIDFTLRDAAGNVIPATLIYDAMTRIATLTPQSSLATLAIYTVTIQGVHDLTGLEMASPYSWSFTTAPADTTPPTVLSRTPSHGATNISNAAPALSVMAVFNEAVQPGTILFTLTDSMGNPISTTVTYDTISRTAALIPNEALNFGVTYIATLSGALDLSGNAMTGTSWSFTTGSINDATLFATNAVPSVVSAGDTSALELGVKFSSDVGGYITGLRFYKGPLNLGTHVAHIWAANDTLHFGPCPGCPCGAVCFLRLAGGSLLASATFTNETAEGWQEVTFSQPVFIMPGVTYIASYSAPFGGFSYDDGYFTNSGIDSGVLHAPSSGASGGNGVFGAANTFPTSTYNGRNYWVDPIFSNNKEDRTAPTIAATTPVSGASAVAATTAISTTFSEVVNTGSVAYSVVDSAGNAIAVTASWTPAADSQTGNTLVLTPLNPLSPQTTYTVTINGATDASGNVMAAPATWSFTTARDSATMGITIWTEDATPAVATSDDPDSVVLGVKFSSSTAGTITGVRFYKGAGNTGTHVGYLWTASGTLLASATFSGESASGWQEVSFDTPVPIAANTTYVVGYLAPNGGYSYTSAYFANGGAGTGVLQALSSGTTGGNGVFAYGGPGTFPNGSYNSTNYWVDAVFVQSVETAPTTTTLISSANSSTYGQSVTFTATVSSPVGMPTDTVTFMDGATPLGTVALSATGTATFTTSLAIGSHSITAIYNGNTAFAASTSLTLTQLVTGTIWTEDTTPAIATANDFSSVVLGVKFSSSTTGTITGVRFYKGAGNTGTHVGYLWTASGTLLASATFSGESASGWQEVSFDTPGPIAANTTYVVGYLAPNGGYSYSPAYFANGGAGTGVLQALSSGTAGGNGVFAYGGPGTFPNGSFNSTNYWVDAVFAPDNIQAPTATTLASSANPSTYGQSVTLTATVSAAIGMPTGTVTFMEGSTTLGTAALSATGTATFTTSSLTFGSHSIIAIYSGDAGYSTSTSSTLTQTVNPATTTTALTSSANPSTLGQSVTFTATVSSGGGTPTGTVTFADASGTLATINLDASGVAIFTTDSLASGTHAITATYNGDTLFTSSISGVVSQTVQQTTTATALASSLNPSAFGQSVTFTATVSSSLGTPTGTVTFMEGSTTLGTATLNASGVATLVLGSLSAGGHSIIAIYSGSTSYQASTSTALSQTVNKTATTTTLASSLNPSAFGQSVTFTATVSAGTGMPTGIVTFKDGSTTLGTATLDGSGVATLALGSLSTGSHSITATYSESSSYLASASSSLSQTVNKAATTTSLTSSANPSAIGQSVTFTATASSSGGTPGGTITFKDGSTTLGTVTLNGSGVATYTTSSLSTGSHSVTATYNGGTSYLTSASPALAQSVKRTSTTTLTSSANPSTFGQSVTFTATVSGSSGTPSGTVTFMDGTTTLGTATLNGQGRATFAVNTLAIGGHSITATYNGNSTYMVSTSTALNQTVNKAATSTALSSSANPSAFGQSVTFTATVSSSGGTPGGTVTFKDGSTTLGTATLNGSGKATFTTSSLSIGSHSITAAYSGDTSFAVSTSSTLNQSINKAASTTALISSTNPSAIGQSVTFTATVTGGSGTPGGTVTFKDGSTTLGTVTLNGSGKATYTTSSLTGGSHSITATYNGNSTYLTSVSPTFTQTVNKAASTTTVVSSANPSLRRQSVTFTATVTGSVGTPTGTVTFKDGSATLGTVTLNGSGKATYTTSSLSTGSHSITATYNGNSTYLTSVSPTLIQVVNQPQALNIAGEPAVPTLAVESQPLTESMLTPIIAEAVNRWRQDGWNEQALASLSQIQFQIADLPGTTLGLSGPGVILIDRDAAGYGWFVDTTPGDDAEFAPGAQGPAVAHVDLLSVVSHELGHELGLGHDDDDDVMDADLPVGTRRTAFPASTGNSVSSAVFDAALEQVDGVRNESVLRRNASDENRLGAIAALSRVQTAAGNPQGLRPGSAARTPLVHETITDTTRGGLARRLAARIPGSKGLSLRDNGLTPWSTEE